MMTRLLLAAVLVGVCLPHAAIADDSMDYAPEDDAQVGTDDPNARAMELYDKGQYEPATLLLFRQLAGDPGSLDRQHAEFVLGKTLYHMGFRAGALVYFSRIARAGPEHRYRIATLRWLAALANELPETAGVLDALGEYSADELTDPAVADVAESLAFWAARGAYRAGDLGRALANLKRIGADGELAARAQLLEGATRVRKGQWKKAVALFRSVTRSKTDGEQREGARMQLARALYSSGDYAGAIKEYDEIEPSSPQWPTALFEAAWAHLLVGDQSAKALGNLFSLDTPYLETEEVPEARWLEAIVYHSHCQYDRAVTAVRDYERELVPVRQELARIARRLDGDASQIVAELSAASTDPAYAATTRRLLVRALDAPAVRRAQELTARLDEEIASIDAADPSWKTTGVAAELLQELSLSRSYAAVDAGKAAGEALRDVRLELRELSRNGKKLRIDALEKQAEDVKFRARGGEPVPKNRRSRIPRDDEHYQWGESGEIWRDEVGSIYKPVTDRCPEPRASP